MGKSLSRSRNSASGIMKARKVRAYAITLLHRWRRRVLRWESNLRNLLSKVSPRNLIVRGESRRAHASTIVDLFASLMVQVDNMEVDKMEMALDILRHEFPNVEHIWLAERFQVAYEARYPLDVTLELAATNRSEAERLSLALEIFVLLHRIGGSLTNPNLFREVTNGLKLPGMHEFIESILDGPETTLPKPMESLCFSEKMSADCVMLPESEKGICFRAIRCVNLLLIVNDGEVPFTVRGQKLTKGSILPISNNHTVQLNKRFFSYHTILTLIQARYTGTKIVNFIHMEGDQLAVTRQRPLNCIARIKFGIYVEIEVLRNDAQFVLDGNLLLSGDTVTTSYYTPFTIRGQGPYIFADLSNADTMGHSFQLDPAIRRILVTNLPYMNRPGVLMLTPWLAPGVMFEVQFARSTNTGTLRLLEGSGSSLKINDIPVKGEVELKDGDLIGLSASQYLRCRFSAGVLEEESSTISSLSVRGLTRDFVRSGRVVDNILFSLKRGEMACILGPSGSGKSTLLSILAGHLEPSFGSIRYNGEQITPNSANLRRYIAFIPREDILDEAMTVGEHIYQASIARRPRLTHAERKRRVLSVLGFVGIGHLANRTVGRAGERTISDGERTRLNLGLDLTGTAEVFLVDEPISGLSSRDAERVIDTLEEISHGRILICTLHRPAQTLLNRFDKVMVLDAHGKMAFWGTPREMSLYFNEAAHELKLRIPDEAVAAGGADYVFEVLEAPYRRIGENRIADVNLWQERFEKSDIFAREAAADNYKKNGAGTNERRIPTMPRRHLMDLWRLFRLWMMRTFLSRIRSRMGLYAVLMEGPVLALLIAGTLRAASDDTYTFYKALHINEYLFLSLVLAMFFGLTDAACEILRDRPILRRESNYKLFVSGYLTAKVLVLTGIAGLQCSLYLLVGNLILGIYGMFWDHFLVMLLTAFVGISLSLMVSAFVRSDRTALNIVPLLLVPQILLAGALVRFEEMNEFSPRIPDGVIPEVIDYRLSNLRHRVAYQDEETHEITSKPVPLIAEFCPLRYAFEMLFVIQTSENLWDKASAEVNEKREQYKASGSTEQLRYIQRTALASNGSVSTLREAWELLRRVRKAARMEDEEYLENIFETLDSRATHDDDQPAEFFFSNRKLAAIREGVNTARKDVRQSEQRGFFLAPRQAPPFSTLDQETDRNSISTVERNAVYLFIMGIIPILLAGWKLRRIAKGK